MCCIFTCCGWMIDLVQRVWVFAMSCCISSAICCVLITSSMSGVALGYNYSLAEYIDMKETNVSVYVKRGVFDDEITDDTGDWRRRGHQPIGGFVRDDGNLKTAAPNEPEQMPLDVERSGRRLEDSILESESNHKFEGNLMKLTVSPPHPSTTTKGITSDLEMLQAMSPFTQGSLDQLKAIQGIINKRKMSANRDVTARDKSTYNFDERNLLYATGHPGKLQEEQIGRRMMHMLGRYVPQTGGESQPGYSGPTINPARLAVPDPGIRSALHWAGPKMPQLYTQIYDPNEFGYKTFTYPKPVTYNTGPIRPTQPIPDPTMPPAPLTTEGNRIDQEADIQHYKDKLTGGKDGELDRESFVKPLDSMIAKTEPSDYYEEESVRGLPVRRKKRSIIPIQKKREKFTHKINPSLNSLSKFKGGKSISNQITDYPSILVSKLHFSNNVELNETSTSEREEMNRTKTAEVNVDYTHSIMDSKYKVLKLIRSMFS